MNVTTRLLGFVFIFMAISAWYFVLERPKRDVWQSRNSEYRQTQQRKAQSQFFHRTEDCFICD